MEKRKTKLRSWWFFKFGAFYVSKAFNTRMRLVNIESCQGVEQPRKTYEIYEKL